MNCTSRGYERITAHHSITKEQGAVAYDDPVRMGLDQVRVWGRNTAHCHFGLGKLYRRTGKREQAREHLTTATTMYREMGMTYWLEQAGPELRELP
jgi:hypothetical protein